MRRIGRLALATVAASTLAYQTSAQPVNVADGERMFRACVPPLRLTALDRYIGPADIAASFETRARARSFRTRFMMRRYPPLKARPLDRSLD
jgi:hypothetical protein